MVKEIEEDLISVNFNDLYLKENWEPRFDGYSWVSTL